MTLVFVRITLPTHDWIVYWLCMLHCVLVVWIPSCCSMSSVCALSRLLASFCLVCCVLPCRFVHLPLLWCTCRGRDPLVVLAAGEFADGDCVVAFFSLVFLLSLLSSPTWWMSSRVYCDCWCRYHIGYTDQVQVKWIYTCWLLRSKCICVLLL